MDFLKDSIETGKNFLMAANDIEEDLKIVREVNLRLFVTSQKDDDIFSFINSVRKLQKSFNYFNNLFNDFSMELEIAEEEQWLEEQIQSEGSYYGEVAYGFYKE